MSQIVTTQNTNNQLEIGLSHGQFHIGNFLVSPLTQEQIADGWNLILPNATKKATSHHFSLYLSQLPPHLWSKLTVNKKNPEMYYAVKDKIYIYSVKVSKHDSDVRELFSLVNMRVPNKVKIAKKFEILQNARVKGWVMIKAENILNA